MDTGSSSLKTRKNISSMANILGAIACAKLPGFHAFTGSDNTASYMRKGKVCQFDVIIKNEEFLDTFTRLGQSDIVTSELSRRWSATFVLCMVSPIHKMLMQRNTKSSAKCMLHILLTNHERNGKPWEKIKSADPCCLPPCKTTLQQKIKRSNYVPLFWRNSTMARLPGVLPGGHGWELYGKTLVWAWGTTNVHHHLFEVSY